MLKLIAKLAWIDLPVSAEISLLTGVGLTIAGTVLQWQLPRRRMSCEERMKDGKLTELEAKRMIRLQAIVAPLLTLVGAGLMIWVLLGHLG